MPVKYHCPSCGRRFTDWGAEKLGFKCPPDCEGTLIRVGAQSEEPVKRATLKRRKKVEKADVPVFAGFDDDAEDGAEPGLALGGGDDAAIAPFTDEEGGEIEEVAGADFDGDAGDDED
jgi:hypothetical protein